MPLLRRILITMLAGLGAVAASPAHGVRLTPLTSFSSFYSNADYSPAWSPRGDEVAFVRLENQCGNYHYCWSATLYLLTLGRIESFGAFGNADPAFARDGSTAYAVVHTDSESGREEYSNIGVYRAGIATLLTSGEHFDRQPAWSPDGTRIVFSSNRGGNFDLWVVPSAGGTPVQWTHDSADDTDPAWSPDGSRVAFASRRSGNADLWLQPVAGGPPVQLTNDPADDTEPSWSPDGRFIAFGSMRSGNWDLWVVRVDTGTVSQVTMSQSSEREPAWSPDGTRMVFVSDDLIWLATDIGTVGVTPVSWSGLKSLYR